SQRRVEWLPVLTGEERSQGALDSCHPACCLSVAWSNTVPDTPDVFPAFPTFAVEEGVLQRVGFISIPAALNIDLVTRFEPAISVDPRSERVLVLAPGENIPRKTLIGGTALRLKRQRMADLLSRERERQRHALLRVAIDS